MEVSFAADQKPVTTPEKQAQPTEVVNEIPADAKQCEGQVPATIPSGAVAKPSIFRQSKLPTFRDITLPRVNLVHNVGRLKDTFTPGELVLGQTAILFTPPRMNPDGTVKVKGTDPATMVVMEFQPTRFSEKVAGGARGMLVNTEEEVTAANGTLDYKEWEMKRAGGLKLFQPLAEAVVLIQRPSHLKDDGTVFIHECEGHKYAIALWSMKGTAYTQVAKKVLFTNRLTGYLNKGYPTWAFNVSAFQDSSYANPTWIPKFVPKGKTSPAFQNFVDRFMNPPEEEQSE